jgi:folate-binding protein YgfZ
LKGGGDVLLDEYRALREGAGLVDRSGRGKIVVAGADRRTYLHAMLTNDIAGLGPGTGCYAAYLTPQGRMIADMWVYELGDVCLLDVHPSVKDVVIKRLDQFIFSEDVKLGDLTEAFAGFGIYGPRSADVVANAIRSGGSADGPAVASLVDLTPLGCVRVPFLRDPVIVVATDKLGVRGLEIIHDRRLGEPLHEALVNAGGIDVGSDAFTAVRIEVGRPKFPIDMDQDTIPLEAGIEKEAISFTKGCYPGQEVVIRILHRGRGLVAKKLAGLIVSDETVPVRGDRLAAGDAEVGHVTSAAYSPSLGCPLALGYVAREFLEPGTEVTIAHGDKQLSAVVGVLPFIAPVW